MMTSHTPTDLPYAKPVAQSQEPIDEDLYCLSCGYNVRGLTGNPIRCPECGDSNDCTADEICTLGGYCVPRSSEVRYCMKKCSSHGDCRDKYECRELELMQQHGGEPVQPPGETADPNDPQGFCATAPLE